MKKTTKIVQIDGHQAVIVPKDFSFVTDTVYIRQVEGEIILSARKLSWKCFFNQPSAFREDFLEQRDNLQPQFRAEK